MLPHVVISTLFLLPLAVAEAECMGNDCPMKVNYLLQSSTNRQGAQQPQEAADFHELGDSNECGEGHSKLGLEECKNYAEADPDLGEVEVVDYGKYPGGCYRVGTQMRFNEANGRAHTDAQLICKTGKSEACTDVDVITTVKAWGSEMSWTLGSCSQSLGSFDSNGDYTHTCCLPPGGVSGTCSDSYGDGWHNGYLTIQGKKYCDTFLSGKRATFVAQSAQAAQAFKEVDAKDCEKGWSKLALEECGEYAKKNGLTFKDAALFIMYPHGCMRKGDIIFFNGVGEHHTDPHSAVTLICKSEAR